MCDQHQITPARRDPSSQRAAGPREADLGLGAGGGVAEQEAVAQRIGIAGAPSRPSPRPAELSKFPRRKAQTEFLAQVT